MHGFPQPCLSLLNFAQYCYLFYFALTFAQVPASLLNFAHLRSRKHSVVPISLKFALPSLKLAQGFLIFAHFLLNFSHLLSTSLNFAQSTSPNQLWPISFAQNLQKEAKRHPTSDAQAIRIQKTRRTKTTWSPLHKKSYASIFIFCVSLSYRTRLSFDNHSLLETLTETYHPVRRCKDRSVFKVRTQTVLTFMLRVMTCLVCLGEECFVVGR